MSNFDSPLIPLRYGAPLPPTPGTYLYPTYGPPIIHNGPCMAPSIYQPPVGWPQPR